MPMSAPDNLPTKEDERGFHTERWDGKMFGLYATEQFPAEGAWCLFQTYEQADHYLQLMAEHDELGCDYIILETQVNGEFQNV